MKKLIIATLFVVGTMSASFGAACDKQVEKLSATEEELGMIYFTLDGSDFLAGITGLSYALNNYSIKCGAVEDCIKKLKPKYKKLFQQKGLEWNEVNIEAEYRKAEQAREQAEESCEAAKKRDILE